MNYFEAYQSCYLFGALRYFSNLENSVCLVNGPSGCSFYARNAIINLNGYFESLKKVKIPKIFTVDFSEEDVIFGNENKLRRASTEVIEKYKPKMMFIFNCCVSEIIGVDIDSIAEELSREYSIKVVAIHSAGFKGDHKYGMKMSGKIIADNFFKQRPKKNNKVNILGDFDYFNRNTKELMMQLNKIGINDVLHVPGSCSLEQLQEATSACLNIITCQNASKNLADIMEERFAIPYIGKGYNLYGIDNCFNIYKQIYEFFDKDVQPLTNERNEWQQKIDKIKPSLKEKTAVVVAGTRRALGYSTILKELGVEIKLIFSECDKSYTSKNEFLIYSKNILVNEYFDNLSSQIEKINPDVIFTTLPEMVAPNKYLPRLSDDFSGFAGVLRFAEYLEEYFDEMMDNNIILIND